MRLALPFVVALGIAAGCGPSVQQACDDYAAAFCSRNLACLTGSALATFQGAYGGTQDTCVKNYEGLNCPATAQSPCSPGLSYDTGLEEKCVTDYQNSSCQDVVAGVAPQSCSTSVVCH